MKAKDKKHIYTIKDLLEATQEHLREKKYLAYGSWLVDATMLADTLRACGWQGHKPLDENDFAVFKGQTQIEQTAGWTYTRWTVIAEVLASIKDRELESVHALKLIIPLSPKMETDP